MNDLWTKQKSFEDRTNESIGNITLIVNHTNNILQLFLSQKFPATLKLIELNNYNQFSALDSTIRQMKESFEGPILAILNAQKTFSSSFNTVQESEIQYFEFFASHFDYFNETLTKFLRQNSAGINEDSLCNPTVSKDSTQSRVEEIHKLLIQLIKYIKQDKQFQGHMNHQQPSSLGNLQVSGIIQAVNNVARPIQVITKPLTVTKPALKEPPQQLNASQSSTYGESMEITPPISLDVVSSVIQDSSKKSSLPLPTQNPPEKETEMQKNPIR